MPLRLPVALAAAIILSSAPAFADTYTYSYTGNDFTTTGAVSETALFTGQDYVTVSLTLAAPLGDNFNGYITPLSFDFTVLDQNQATVLDINNADAIQSSFFVTTGPTGTPTVWNFYALYGLGSQVSPLYEIGSSDTGDFATSDDYGYFYNCGLPQACFANPRNYAQDSTINSAGFTVTDNPSPSTTPEPTSLVLAGTGLFGLAAFTRRRRLLKPAAALAIAAAAALIPSTARADTTYDYTGSAFTTLTTSGGASQVYSTGDSITGSVTFASAPDNLTFATFTPVEAFSFSDGVQTISNTTPGLDTTFFQFQTDGSGDIEEWAIQIYTGPAGAQNDITLNWLYGDSSTDHPTGTSAYAEASNAVGGSFSPATAATPEPSSLILAGSGLLGLAAFTRRRLSPGCPTSRF